MGVINSVNGGKFWSGALSGAFASLSGDLLDFATADAGEFSVVRSKGFAIGAGVIFGGLGSVLGGGNFWRGAMNGFFVTTFNHLMHKFDPPKEILVQHWDARYSTDEKQWILNKVSEGYTTVNKPGASDGYQVVNIYNSAGTVVGSIQGNDALYKFNIATKGNFNNIYNLKIMAQSYKTMGKVLKNSGTIIGSVSKGLTVPTEGFSSFGVAIGEATWWGGFGAESYGNFLLKDYNKIWQDALRRGLRYSTKPVFKNKNGYGN